MILICSFQTATFQDCLLLQIVSLSKINQWFLANILSLNVAKAKYSFFHKISKKDDIRLKLPRLQINNYNIERIPTIKFLGVLLDKNLL